MTDIYKPAITKFKVIGVGGFGSRIASRMEARQIPSPFAVEYIAMDVDEKDLAAADVTNRQQIGRRMLRGLGTGNDPELGRMAAEESRGPIRQTVLGTDVVIVVASMGGGTGAGAAPVVAEMAYLTGALTIGMVTPPLWFEGDKRMSTCDYGFATMGKKVDSLITILPGKQGATPETCEEFDVVLNNITDPMSEWVDMVAGVVSGSGMINLDIAELRLILKDSGQTSFSTGSAAGNDRGAQCVYAALANLTPLKTKRKAKAALVTFVGGNNLTLNEVNAAADIIKHEIDPDANLAFGIRCDQKLGDEMRVGLTLAKFPDKEDD